MRRGFTLIEMMIVIAISSLIILAVVQLILSYSGLYRVQQAAIDVGVSANHVMTAIEPAIMQASSVVSSYTFSGISYSTGSTTLVLQIPSVDGNGNTVPNAYDYAVFYATGTAAISILAPNQSSVRLASTHTLSSTLKSLTFSYNNATVVQANAITVDVQTQASTTQGLAQSHLTQRFPLRNSSY